MILRGKVKSGSNNLSYWMERMEDLYYAKTGLHLYPGSLNVELEEPYILPEDVIRIEKEEYGGIVSLSLCPCEIFGRKAFILRTDRNASGKGEHPLTLIEIITDIRLRDAHQLADGDVVEVSVGDGM